MKGLDLIVAFRFIDRDEKGFDAAEQAQAHHLTDDVRMSVSTTKRPFIIKLLQLRQPQFGPCFPQVRDRSSRWSCPPGGSDTRPD